MVNVCIDCPLHAYVCGSNTKTINSANWWPGMKTALFSKLSCVNMKLSWNLKHKNRFLSWCKLGLRQIKTAVDGINQQSVKCMEKIAPFMRQEINLLFCLQIRHTVEVWWCVGVLQGSGCDSPFNWKHPDGDSGSGNRGLQHKVGSCKNQDTQE